MKRCAQNNLIPIWLDCDPGHDDMMAIMLAAQSDALDLRGISSTHGNQTVQKTFRNAVRTVWLTGREIPVYQGFSEPLVRKSRACPEIHGESGLGGFDWSQLDSKLDFTAPSIEQFFEALLREINAHWEKSKSQFTIVTTASFTNIAQFIKAHPECAERIKLVSMAGNFKVIGNIEAWAEFNVLIDPEAAQYILDCGVHVTFVPLDVTHTVLFDPTAKKEVVEACASNSKFCTLIVNLLEFFQKTYKDVFGFDFPPVHDPAAVFYLLHSELFETVNVHVDIETKGQFTSGACCADWYKQWSTGENATVCLKVDVPAFWHAMAKALERCATQGGFK